MRRILILPVMLLMASAAYAQSTRIFSISTGPGEDASTQMGISWATDTTMTGTYVLLSRKGELGGVKIHPQQQERWTAFKGIWSDMPDGREFHEDAVFTKCGTMVDGLQPDTEYQYVIRTDSGEQSGTHFFKTAGAKEWSCCIISDFHSYTPLPSRLESSMGMIGKVKEYDPSVSWVFSPGDVVAWGGSYSFWKRLFEEPEFSRMMWARVNGNHDNWTKESQVTHNFDIPNDFFLGTSYFPRNGYEAEMGVCYHFRYGNTLFVMINSEDLDKEGEMEAAADWVRNVVTEARKSLDPPTFVVVCEHVEWFLGTDGRDSFHKRWAAVFDELGVDLALAGNNHVYLRSYPLYGGVRDDEKGTIYMMTPASDNDRGREISKERFANIDKIAKRWTEGSHSVGAVHMAACDTSLTLTLLDRYGHEIDRCIIKSKTR